MPVSQQGIGESVQKQHFWITYHQNVHLLLRSPLTLSIHLIEMQLEGIRGHFKHPKINSKNFIFARGSAHTHHLMVQVHSRYWSSTSRRVLKTGLQGYHQNYVHSLSGTQDYAPPALKRSSTSGRATPIQKWAFQVACTNMEKSDGFPMTDHVPRTSTHIHDPQALVIKAARILETMASDDCNYHDQNCLWCCLSKPPPGWLACPCDP